MSDNITVIIIVDGARKTLSVPINCTILHLFDQVRQMVRVNDADTLFLVCDGQQLQHDRDQTLKTYNIINMSTITVAIRVLGGTFTDIQNHVTRTYDTCGICLDDGKEEYRAKMHCKHIICSGCMRDFCSKALKNGLFCFKCPMCPVEWPYEHVRHVACFSDDDMVEKSQFLNANFLKYGKAMQHCPTCQNYCLRELDNFVGPRNFVDCPICTKRLGKKTSFCWSCLGPWLSGANGRVCGNPGCDGKDVRLRELAMCGTKNVGNVRGCPEMRGCERCAALIVHQNNCKHVTCHSCQYAFCFVCLKTPTNGEWTCGPAYEACISGVAPRQTSLPGVPSDTMDLPDSGRRLVTEILHSGSQPDAVYETIAIDAGEQRKAKRSKRKLNNRCKPS